MFQTAINENELTQCGKFAIGLISILQSKSSITFTLNKDNYL